MNYTGIDTNNGTYQQGIDHLVQALTSHPKWRWRRGMATKSGGIVTFVGMYRVAVTDMSGSSTFYSKPTKSNLVSINQPARKPVEDLAKDITLEDTTSGVLIDELLRSDTVEEIMIRRENEKEYQLTVFYSGGPVVYEGAQKGSVVAQALYETFMKESVGEVEYEQQN